MRPLAFFILAIIAAGCGGSRSSPIGAAVPAPIAQPSQSPLPVAGNPQPNPTVSVTITIPTLPPGACIVQIPIPPGVKGYPGTEPSIAPGFCP